MDKLDRYPWQAFLDKDGDTPAFEPESTNLAEVFLDNFVAPLTRWIGRQIDAPVIQPTTPRKFFSEEGRRIIKADNQTFGALFGVAVEGSGNTIERAVGCHIDGDANRVKTAIRTSVFGKGNIVDAGDRLTVVRGMGSFQVKDL